MLIVIFLLIIFLTNTFFHIFYIHNTFFIHYFIKNTSPKLFLNATYDGNIIEDCPFYFEDENLVSFKFSVKVNNIKEKLNKILKYKKYLSKSNLNSNI